MTLESAIVSWLWYLTRPVLVSLLLRNLLLASTNLCWPCLDLQPMASSYHPRLRRSLLGHLHSCHRGQQNSRFVGPPWEIAQAESLKQQMFVSLQFWKSKIEAPSGLHSGRTSRPGLQRAPPHRVLLRPCSPCALALRAPRGGDQRCLLLLPFSLGRIRLFSTPWTIACQAPLSVGFSRKEYWSGLPFPPPGDLPDQGWNPRLLCLLHWQVDSLPLSHLGSPWYLLLFL